MEISHVLRGVEWQISTTKHLLMYRCDIVYYVYYIRIFLFYSYFNENLPKAISVFFIPYNELSVYYTSASSFIIMYLFIINIIFHFRAFDWKPPIYGHLPLLLNADGTKLSKRQKDIKIGHYRENGIFPLALINFIVNSGGGFDKDLERGMKPKCFTMDQLAQQVGATLVYLSIMHY